MPMPISIPLRPCWLPTSSTPAVCCCSHGTQERGLQKVVASLDAKRYHLTESADIPWDEITHLVLVDTRQRERVRHVSTLLDREGVTVEVWDHHPASSEDVPAQTSHVETVGSVTALLVRELRQRGIVLEAADATLLGLGIYGDTGSFTYSSTTPLDFESSAWLLTQGMDVNAINEMAAHELTSLHVRALNSLLESARVYHINNEPVVIAEASMEHYLGDFAYLAHRLMEMEKFTVLFAVGRPWRTGCRWWPAAAAMPSMWAASVRSWAGAGMPMPRRPPSAT